MTRPAIDGATRFYGVLGHPVRASLSPALHNAAFAALGINAVYLPLPLHPRHLLEGVRGLLAVGIAGFNLTVPHKQAILPLLDDVAPAARHMGAVNTVRVDEGRLLGTNTDGAGFLLSLQRDLGWQAAGKRVLMLGAGGAGRGVGQALLLAGAAALIIANRTPVRAEELARALAARFPGREVAARTLDAAGEGLAVHLVVNTTSVGMGDGASPLNLSTLSVSEGVADIVYSPALTPLLAQAQALGLPHTNGIGMLLYQGWEAFRFWTGREAPIDVMRAALLAGLAARG